MSTTRRTLLAGLALPTACLPTFAQPSDIPALHPDAALLALIASVPALAERSRVLGREHDRIEAACFDRAGQEPPKPACDPSAFPDFRDFDRALNRWQSSMKARDARLVAAGEALGFKMAEQAFNAADGALVEACEAVAAIQATTLAGLIAKARLAENERFPELRDSIVDDLLAMGGQA